MSRRGRNSAVVLFSPVGYCDGYLCFLFVMVAGKLSCGELIVLSI